MLTLTKPEITLSYFVINSVSSYCISQIPSSIIVGQTSQKKHTLTYRVNCFSKLTLVISRHIESVTAPCVEPCHKSCLAAQNGRRRFTHKVISKSNSQPTLMEYPQYDGHKIHQIKQKLQICIKIIFQSIGHQQEIPQLLNTSSSKKPLCPRVKDRILLKRHLSRISNIPVPVNPAQQSTIYRVLKTLDTHR